MPSIAKFDIINDALAATDNNLAVAADLTLPEHDPNNPDTTASFVWDRASRSYDRELPLLLESADWPFAKTTEALEQADEDDNPSNRYGYAYDWPFSALWLEKVEAPGGLPIPYEIIGRFICMDYDGTDDDAPVATFTQVPLDKTTMSNLFWEVLRRRVEVGCLRNINEDFPEANAREDKCDQIFFPFVRTRTAQQLPARKAFRSTMLERRRSGGGPRVF